MVSLCRFHSRMLGQPERIQAHDTHPLLSHSQTNFNPHEIGCRISNLVSNTVNSVHVLQLTTTLHTLQPNLDCFAGRLWHWRHQQAPGQRRQATPSEFGTCLSGTSFEDAKHKSGHCGTFQSTHPQWCLPRPISETCCAKEGVQKKAKPKWTLSYTKWILRIQKLYPQTFRISFPETDRGLWPWELWLLMLFGMLYL
jgi:hypothetical protein